MPSAMLRIRLLGAVEAWFDHEPLPLHGEKQRLVLAHLALADGHFVSTGALSDDLWVQPPRNPRHALQAHVSRLRSLLPVPIDHSEAGYRLVEGGWTSDVREFAQHLALSQEALNGADLNLALQHIDSALSLWRGDLVTGLEDAHGLRPAVTRLEQQREQARSKRADLMLFTERADEVLPDLRALVDTHPLHERYTAQLMTALALTGDRPRALDLFHLIRDSLRERLGTDVGPVLQAVHVAILRDEDPRSALGGPEGDLQPTSAPSASSGPSAASFFGRETDLRQLEALWTRAQDRLVTAVVTGDAGIGKTRLVHEFLALREQDGTRVLTGGFDEARDIALEPLVTMVQADAPLRLRTTEHSVANLSSERIQLFEALTDWIEEFGGGSGFCLFVDDLQWSDPETLLFLTHLIRHHQDVPMLLIVAFRDREDEQMQNRLRPLMRQWDDLVHLPLSGLNDAESTTLLAAELGRAGGNQDTTALPTHIHELSGGNPLFIVELARHLSRSHTPDADAASEVPDSLRTVITARLEPLAENARNLLDHAALIGREFDLELLRHAAEVDAATVDEAMTQLVFARLVEPRPDRSTVFRFCHDAVRHTVMSDLGPLRRADAHRRIALSLESLGSATDPDRWHRLGHHFAESATTGTSAKASHYLQQAGRLSLEHRAPEAAVDLFTRAVELLDAEAAPHVRIDLLLELGTAELHSGLASYRETFLRAAELSRAEGDAARLVRAAAANNRGWYSSTTGLDTERVLYLESALRVCPADDLRSRAELLQTWALENVREPLHRDEALARSAEALELAAQLQDDAFLAQQMAQAYGVRFATFSNPRDLLTFARRLAELTERLDDPSLTLSAAVGLAQIGLVNADHPAADRALAQAERLAELLNEPARLWLVRSWQAARLSHRGHPEQADRVAAAAYELGTGCEPEDALTWYLGQVFVMHHQRGELHVIREAIDDQVQSHAHTIPGWRAAHALTFASTGLPDEAGTILQQFANDPGLLPRDMLWLPCMAFLAEAAFLIRDHTSAPLLYEQLQAHSGLMATNGTIDAGPVDLHLAGLALTVGDPRWANKHLDLSAELCQRAGALVWAGRTEAMRSLVSQL